MRTTQVLVVSAIAHAPFVVLLADAVRSPRPRPHFVAPMPPRAPSPAASIEIAFVADEPVAAADRDGDAPDRAGDRDGGRRGGPGGRGGDGDGGPAPAPRGSERIAAGVAIEPGAARPETGRSVPGGSPWLRMRGPDLRLETGTAERIAGAGARSEEQKRSGRLESAPGGRAVVHDRVATMRVDADGKVHFDDKQDVDLKLQPPIPRIWDVERIRRDLGYEMTDWFKDPEASARFRSTSDLPRHLQASQYACDQWGATFCDDPLAPRIEKRVRDRKKVDGVILGGSMDITAWLHRKYVGDPYLSRKRKLLDATRDERVAMGERHRAQQDARSAELMRKNLERLWASERDPVARRAALFQLWDECTDADAGARARAVVIGWIRARLPAGSPDAYSESELELLQQHKTSSAAFAPYRD